MNLRIRFADQTISLALLARTPDPSERGGTSREARFRPHEPLANGARCRTIDESEAVMWAAADSLSARTRVPSTRLLRKPNVVHFGGSK
jgi:hypothetical protein